MRRMVLFSAMLLFSIALATLMPYGVSAADDAYGASRQASFDSVGEKNTRSLQDDTDLGIAEIETPKNKASFGLEITINFTAQYSGDIVYLWNFGDGSALAYGRVVEHSYAEYGKYTVILTCIDEQGGWDNDSIEVRVLGTLGEYPMYIQVITTICCLMPFFLPFLIVMVIAIIVKYIIKAASHIEWKVKHLTILGVVLISIPTFLIISLLVMIFTLSPLPLLFMAGILIAGTIAWIGAGFLSIFPLAIAVKLLLKLPLGFRDGLCIVRKPLPIEKKFVGEQKKFSLKNFLEFACDLSLNPLFLTFFIMSITSYNMKTPLDFFSITNIILLILAPVITFFVIPLQILLDSNLMYVKKDRKSGILMLYLGATFKNVLQNLLGVGAIAAFISIFLNIGSGAELDQIFYAFLILFIIIPVIYPGIFLVTCIYSLVHNTLVRKFNDRLDRIVLKEYRIKEHKEDTRFVAMVPITYQTQTLEQIQKHKELADRRGN